MKKNLIQLITGVLVFFTSSCNIFRAELSVQKDANKLDQSRNASPAGISASLIQGSAAVSIPTYPNAIAYKIYYSTNIGIDSSSLNFMCTNPSACEPLNLTCGKTYYFKYSVILANRELGLSPDTASLTKTCNNNTNGSSGAPGSIPLSIVSTSPLSGATSFNPGNPISVTFNGVDPSSVSTASIQVKRVATSAIVAGSVVSDATTLTFYPVASLMQNETYSVTLFSANFANTTNQRLATDYNWSFSTNTVTAVAGRGSVHLEWPTIPTAVGYKIFRSSSSPVSTAGSYLSYTSNLEFQDSSADNLTLSYYRIVPFDGSVDIAGQLTSEVSSQASVLRPGVPKTLGASCGESGQVSLSWSAPIEGVTPATYAIYRSTSATPNSTDILTTSNINSYVDTTVTNGIAYSYRVAAISSSGLKGVLSESASSCPIAPATVSAALVFVDIAAAGGGNGSFGLPFNTLAAGLAAVAPSGTVVLKSGTYTIGATNNVASSYFLRSVTGTYVNSGVTINPTVNTIQTAFSIPAGGVTGFGLTGINFTGFGDGTANTTGVIYIANTSATHNVVLQNNNIDTNLIMGVFATRSGATRGLNWRIIGNRVNSAGGNALVSCFRVYYLENSTIADNTLSNCNYGGLLLNEVVNVNITRNTISTTGRSGISVGTNVPAYGFAISHNNITSANTGNNPGYGAIRISDLTSGQAWISYNFAGTSFAGFTVYTAGATLVGSLKLRSNQFSNNSSFGINNLSTQNVTIDADANFFGCAAGPGQAGCDTVSTYVNFGTPLTASPL